jgi:hypothetical protein
VNPLYISKSVYVIHTTKLGDEKNEWKKPKNNSKNQEGL